jgi:hypothetical protein
MEDLYDFFFILQTYWWKFRDWATLRAITYREFFLKWSEEQQEKLQELLDPKDPKDPHV